MNYQIRDNEFIIGVDKIPTFDEYCASIKVSPEGFASYICKKIYREVFIYSTDIMALYTSFYSIEYSTIEEFIYSAYGTKIDEESTPKKHILLVKGNLSLIDVNYQSKYIDTIFSNL